MTTATISETKNSLSALLDRVRQGESILITDRSRPVARLERAGLIRRARTSRLEEILRVAPPSLEPGGDVLAALLDERRSGR